GIVIFNQVPDGFTIEKDPLLFSVILHNIIDNSIKVNRNGWVRLCAYEQEGNKYIVVSDNGSGLPKHILNWFNSPFIHGEEEPVTGLGLIMIRELVLIMEIEAKAELLPDRGTRFIFKV